MRVTVAAVQQLTVWRDVKRGRRLRMLLLAVSVPCIIVALLAALVVYAVWLLGKYDE